MSSNCRRIPTSQHPLRKQASIADPVFPAGLPIPRTFAASARRIDRFKYANFQKQFSVDQVFSANNSVRQKFNNGSSPLQRGSVVRTVAAYGLHRTSGGNGVSTSVHTATDDGENATTNANLKIFPALKKRMHPPKGYGDNKKDKVIADRTRRSSKVADDRVNLKIFLDQNINRKDSEHIDSSETSSEETESEDINNLEPKNREKAKEEDPKPVVLKPAAQSQWVPTSAASRRAQFHSSRTIEGHSIKNTALTIASNLSLTVERRPPLVRAMSAPIRTHDENTKQILANKRKIRRRKLISNRQQTFDEANESTVIENKTPGNIETPSEASRTKSSKKPISRARSALGCDVVTLVSLISSEGSDTEKEEPSVTVDSHRMKRPPLLRKSGKSVSFQEDELNFNNGVKEFPHMIRRGSVAPLAARIRANRPPTAPPGSIFIRSFEASETKMSTMKKSASKEDLVEMPSSQAHSKENLSENANVANDSQFPDYVRSLKERECWKLFQKMLNKGISVSYDTILRGMLTPTELRLLQKQKEIEEARKAKELEEAETNK